MVHFQFQIFGEKQVGFMMDNLGTKLSNYKESLEQIAKDYYVGEKSTFSAEGAFEGKPSWAQLSPEYERRKKEKYGNQPILVRTGSLRKAVTNRNARGSIFRLTKLSLVVGANIPVGGWNLAMLHQLGTSKMPAREVVRITPTQEKRWIRIFRDFIWKKVGEVRKRRR